MSNRNETTSQIVLDGKLYTILDNPTIEDVLVTEAQVQAEGIVSGKIDTTRRVDRAIREILIRFGVER